MGRAGTNIMILKIFTFVKNGEKIGVFYSKYCHVMPKIGQKIGFQEKHNYFTENWKDRLKKWS
jgi:hypothetical protein